MPAADCRRRTQRHRRHPGRCATSPRSSRSSATPRSARCSTGPTTTCARSIGTSRSASTTSSTPRLACRFLGYEETGLEAVLRNIFGITVDKKYQRKDWSRRPLPEEMLAYAASDVRHLAPLAQQAHRRARGRRPARLGRRGMPAAEQGPAGGQLTISPSSSASRGPAASTRAAWPCWSSCSRCACTSRATRTVPCSRSSARTRCLQLAQEKPETLEALGGERRPEPEPGEPARPRRSSPRFGPAWSCPPRSCRATPTASRRWCRPRSATASRRLRTWRDATARRLKIDPALVCPKATMLAVAERRPGEDGGPGRRGGAAAVAAQGVRPGHGHGPGQTEIVNRQLDIPRPSCRTLIRHPHPIWIPCRRRLLTPGMTNLIAEALTLEGHGGSRSTSPAGSCGWRGRWNGPRGRGGSSSPTRTRSTAGTWTTPWSRRCAARSAARGSARCASTSGASARATGATATGIEERHDVQAAIAHLAGARRDRGRPGGLLVRHLGQRAASRRASGAW